MQDKNNDVGLLRIPEKWFNLCAKVFMCIMGAFTAIAILDQLGLKMKFAQDFFDNKWLHRGSVLMTLTVGYIFIVARSLHRITLNDSNISYKKGQNEYRENLIGLVRKNDKASYTKNKILGILESGDYDP